MKKWIAKRELLYSLKGSSEKNDLIIRISEPYLLKEDMISFPFSTGTAGCTIEFIGLKESFVYEGTNVQEVYGADTIQALEFAVDIDPILKWLSKNMIFIFLVENCISNKVFMIKLKPITISSPLASITQNTAKSSTGTIK
ncbi:MAG: hypothetical protein AB8D52_08150 [Gammaproteobacteria bacterium]